MTTIATLAALTPIVLGGGRRDPGSGRKQRGALAMRAHRFRVQIREDHEVRLKLPSDIPAGEGEVIVLESGSSESLGRGARGTVDDLLASRLTPPAGVGPVTLADMEKAIAEGAMGRGGV